MTALIPKYRFGVLLPLFYNDGTPIESDRIEDVRLTLMTRYGAYRFQPDAPYEGEWTDVQADQPPTVYHDNLVMFTVDTDRDESVLRWFSDFKQPLAEVLRQVEIYVAVTEMFWL